MRVWPHKNMAENLLQLGNARFTHKLEDSGIHYKIWWELLPHPPYSTDLAPSDFHQFRALKDTIYGTKFETWWCDSPSENLATWPGQGTELTRHTHTFSSLAQGCRSGWRHCGKIGYRPKPSLFIICHFYDLGINIYLETKGGHFFLGSPHLCWRWGCQSIEISWLMLQLYLNGIKYLLLHYCIIFGSSFINIYKCRFFFKFNIRGSVHRSMIQQKQPTRCNPVSEIIIPLFIEGSTCFEHRTAYHQEL
jgi:hypothetical protein